MASRPLRARLRIERPVGEVFDFLSKAENLGVVTPPEPGCEIRTPLPIAMRPGTVIDSWIRQHGVPMRWRTVIVVWEPQSRFVDEEARGPYAEWIHTHRFRADGPCATIIEDELRYRRPPGMLGDLVHPLVRRRWLPNDTRGTIPGGGGGSTAPARRLVPSPVRTLAPWVSLEEGGSADRGGTSYRKRVCDFNVSHGMRS